MDYDTLREEGIHSLRNLCGTTWTDHNAHDPGITILEQLCYALTDLDYRTRFDIADLLGPGDEIEQCLPTPAKILLTGPITLTDYRKMIHDVPGVRNAWIEPVENPQPSVYFDPTDRSLFVDNENAPHRERVPLPGIHRVWIDSDGSNPTVLDEVSRRLHANRNLSEDFLYPTAAEHLGITLDADIEIGETENPERLLAEILHEVTGFLRPRIPFHSLSEMLAKGFSTEEIFDGPALDHGFIDEKDLVGEGRRTALRSSDLIQVMMAIPQVRAVHGLTISDGITTKSWYLDLETEADTLRIPVLNQAAMFATPKIRLVRGAVKANIDLTRSSQIFKELQQRARPEKLPRNERDFIPVPGRDRKIERYQSIRHQFPAAYGIGDGGLPDSASPERKAKAKQLEGYLAIFEQILANSFSQVAHARDLLSLQQSEETVTYFSQAQEDISEEDSLFTGDLPKEDQGRALDRKSRFLNHILARFGESFADYALLRYAKLGPSGLVKDKTEFLRDYPEISASRAKAFDYTRNPNNPRNVAGIEILIARKLGLSVVGRKSLADLKANQEGGFHLIEHLLLRPRQEDVDQWKEAEHARWQAAKILVGSESENPYAGKITFVFPDWIERFKESGMRTFIASTIRNETPAHLSVSLKWLKKDEMRDFEISYQTWLESLINLQRWK